MISIRSVFQFVVALVIGLSVGIFVMDLVHGLFGNIIAAGIASMVFGSVFGIYAHRCVTRIADTHPLPLLRQIFQLVVSVFVGVTIGYMTIKLSAPLVTTEISAAAAVVFVAISGSVFGLYINQGMTAYYEAHKKLGTHEAV